MRPTGPYLAFAQTLTGFAIPATHEARNGEILPRRFDCFHPHTRELLREYAKRRKAAYSRNDCSSTAIGDASPSTENEG